MRQEPMESVSPASRPPRPRDVFRSFLRDWNSAHALLDLNTHVSVQDALDDIALLAAARGRFGVLVGPEACRLPNFQALPERSMGDSGFLKELRQTVVQRSGAPAEPLVVFAPSEAFVAPWAALDAQLDELGAAAPQRLCLPAHGGLARLGPGDIGALGQRHGASLRL